MKSLGDALDALLPVQQASGKPLAVVLAGHNGSGKSTMWYELLAGTLQIPLVNADRMMMSILPEVAKGEFLPSWAGTLRDTDENWMQVAQKSVSAFVAQALLKGVPFAMETVFSHWKKRDDGTYESKLDLIREMQAAGYFVILIFVGLTSDQLSIGRVQTRKAKGGHDVVIKKLTQRFPRTQKAVRAAAPLADAAVFVDNSRSKKEAFTVCRVQIGEQQRFDMRSVGAPSEIEHWMSMACPPHSA